MKFNKPFLLLASLFLLVSCGTPDNPGLSEPSEPESSEPESSEPESSEPESSEEEKRVVDIEIYDNKTFIIECSKQDRLNLNWIDKILKKVQQ